MNDNSTVNVRKLSLDVIMDIMENDAYSDKAIHAMLDSNSQIEKRDRAFLTRLCEGTVERVIELDYVINLYSKTKTKKMKPVIRDILRMSVYQILYMESVPDSAACNEAVKLVIKRKMTGLKGFVNGVLRTIAREKNNIKYPDKEKDIIKYLNIRYSMPEWIVKRFLDDYGAEKTEKILAGFLSEDNSFEADKKTSARCNISKANVSDIVASLKKETSEVEKGVLLDYAVRFSGYEKLTKLEAFQKGMIQVQDESSMLVGQISGIKAGDTVLDVCAAPGGKSMHAADILKASEREEADKKGKVIACDLSDAKVRLIGENVKRNSFDNIEVVKNDALIFRNEWEGMADVVIADLPCSGLGVIGKKCDIKYKTKPEDIEALSEIQKNILRVVSRYVKKGGILLYSTCTMAKEENENNAAWITKEISFEPKDISQSLPECLKDRQEKEHCNYLQVLPCDAGTDGFFISAFTREA